MLYSKKNYLLMGISLLLILSGFLLMSGGGSINSLEFNPEIFSTRRIVVAPIVCTIGFLLMIWAILYRPKSDKEEER